MYDVVRHHVTLIDKNSFLVLRQRNVVNWKQLVKTLYTLLMDNNTILKYLNTVNNCV
jgi:hypothetical protein